MQSLCAGMLNTIGMTQAVAQAAAGCPIVQANNPFGQPPPPPANNPFGQPPPPPAGGGCTAQTLPQVMGGSFTQTTASIATLTCQPGYTLSNPNAATITCGAGASLFGQSSQPAWSQPLAQCTMGGASNNPFGQPPPPPANNPFGQPPPPPAGASCTAQTLPQVVGGSFTQTTATSATLTCQPGYTLSNSFAATITCQAGAAVFGQAAAGVWSQPQAQCTVGASSNPFGQPPPPPANNPFGQPPPPPAGASCTAQTLPQVVGGSFTQTTATTAQLTCQPGYTLSNPNGATITCMVFSGAGRWSQAQAMCQAGASNNPFGQPPPPPANNPFGQPPPPPAGASCTAQTLPQVVGGSFTQTTATSATLTCQPGYTLSNSFAATITCQAGAAVFGQAAAGVWSQPQAQCTVGASSNPFGQPPPPPANNPFGQPPPPPAGASCTAQTLPQVAGGSFTQTTATGATLTCQPGYTLSNAFGGTITCQAGRWSQPQAVCQMGSGGTSNNPFNPPPPPANNPFGQQAGAGCTAQTLPQDFYGRWVQTSAQTATLQCNSGYGEPRL